MALRTQGRAYGHWSAQSPASLSSEGLSQLSLWDGPEALDGVVAHRLFMLCGRLRAIPGDQGLQAEGLYGDLQGTQRLPVLLSAHLCKVDQGLPSLQILNGLEVTPHLENQPP